LLTWPATVAREVEMESIGSGTTAQLARFTACGARGSRRVVLALELCAAGVPGCVYVTVEREQAGEDGAKATAAGTEGVVPATAGAAKAAGGLSGAEAPWLGSGGSGEASAPTVGAQGGANDEEPPSSGGTGPAGGRAASPAALPPQIPFIDLCDHDDHAGLGWSSYETDHLAIHYLADTAAERDRHQIGVDRERAYEDIRARLALSTTPTVSVYLSPSRTAAEAHGVGFGLARVSRRSVEVIYTGEPESYELSHYGHEIAHVLQAEVLPAGRRGLLILEEGMAVWLDQSGLDLHCAYAQRLNTGDELMTYATGFDEGDVWAENYGRGGSLVQYLASTFGNARLVEIFQLSSVTWVTDAHVHDVVGRVDTPDAVREVLAWSIEEATGVPWSDVELGWAAEISAALESATDQLSPEDRAEIGNLLAVMDYAITTDSAGAYRATMDGFYCNWRGESDRAAIAARVVGALGPVTTELLAAYPLGDRNYPEARLYVTRTDDRDVTIALDMLAEKFPSGWRVTWSPDWRE